VSTPEVPRPPVLEVRGLEVRYGSVPAVRKVDLHVRQGEIVGLIGPNGAGKSTTLHAIVGAVRPNAGAIELKGASIVGQPPERIVRSGVGLVPEGRRIFAELTVEENLRLGLAGRRTKDGAQEALDEVGELFPILRQTRKRQAGLLSGGQQQQLAIARALVGEPELLLLDEPSLGLAPTVVDTVFETLGAIRERGLTILLVEQRAQRTVAFADRTYVLANGELRMTLGPEDADDTERMVAAYFGS
jgi:branched-chain amino acid transport system ATP-binding protein